MQLKGRADAFGMFRDVLAREMVGALPGLGGEVGRVMAAVGGDGGGGGGGGGAEGKRKG